MREPIGMTWASGQTIYVAFWHGGQVYYQLSGGSWQNYNTANDEQYAYELTSYGIGTGRSMYAYPDGFDVARFEPGFATDIGRLVVARYYLRAGSIPDLSTDQVVHEEALHLQFGHVAPRVEVLVQPNVRADLTPEQATFMVTLLADGKPVDLSAVSGNHFVGIEITREGEDVPFIDAEAAISDDGRWYVTFEDPAYTANRSYMGRVIYRTTSGGTDLLARDFSFLGCA